MRRLIFIILLSLGVSEMLHGQDINIYDLLTEPSLVRPLTVHKGFLQICGGYSHINGNNYFDASGVKLPYTETVRSVIENKFSFGLSYGILEYLEFYTGLCYKNRYETLPSYLIDNRPGIGYEDRTFHQHGITNLDLQLKYRLPVFFKGFDMFIYGGINMPLNSQDEKIPSHKITILNVNDPASSYQAQYEFNPAAGNPAIFYAGGIKMLYALDKIGFSMNVNIQNPFSEVETYTWVSRRYGSEFEYLRLWYNLRPKGFIFGGAHLEAQIFPWFAVNTGLDYYRETPGWSDITGQPVSLVRSSLGLLSAGFEIQVSTHLRIQQQLEIPVFGQNIFSEFSVQVGLVYSLVPLKKLHY